MRTETNNQAGLIRRYLLGRLPESEQIAMEERFFEDRELLGEMRAVERDLVDEYVRGQLAPEEKAVFERHYLSTPGHVERVAFARDLLALADAAPAPESSERREPFWRNWLAFVQMPQFAMGAALAMIALLAIFGPLFYRERARWQRELAQAETERAAQRERLRAMEQQIAKGRTDAAQLAAELEGLRRQPPPPPAESRTTIFSFLLLPVSRGSAEQQTLRLAPNAAQVRLQMKIAAGEYDSYRIRLESVDGGDAWESAAVTARPAGKALLLSAPVPARKLPPGDHILTLSGLAPDGTANILETYSFRVLTP